MPLKLVRGIERKSKCNWQDGFKTTFDAMPLKLIRGIERKSKK